MATNKIEAVRIDFRWEPRSTVSSLLQPYRAAVRYEDPTVFGGIRIEIKSLHDLTRAEKDVVLDAMDICGGVGLTERHAEVVFWTTSEWDIRQNMIRYLEESQSIAINYLMQLMRM